MNGDDLMKEFANEMVKRGKVLGYDLKTLNFAVGYMHDLGSLRLQAERGSEPSKLAHDAKWIFAHNAHLHTIVWNDDHVDFAQARRLGLNKISVNGQEYSFK